MLHPLSKHINATQLHWSGPPNVSGGGENISNLSKDRRHFDSSECQKLSWTGNNELQQRNVLKIDRIDK